MAQFDVFVNPFRKRILEPFVVSLQNARFDLAPTRFVAALALRSAAPRESYHLSPGFLVEGQNVVLDPFNLATIPTSRLGNPVASLADEDSRAKLVRAMDEFWSQA